MQRLQLLVELIMSCSCVGSPSLLHWLVLPCSLWTQAPAQATVPQHSERIKSFQKGRTQGLCPNQLQVHCIFECEQRKSYKLLSLKHDCVVHAMSYIAVVEATTAMTMASVLKPAQQYWTNEAFKMPWGLRTIRLECLGKVDCISECRFRRGEQLL